MGAEVTQKKQPPKRNKPFEFYYKYAVEYFKKNKNLNVPQKNQVRG